MFSDDQKKHLLQIAREAVEAAVGGRPLPCEPAGDPALAQKCGAFVTLKTRGRLRGCIGMFVAEGPLYQTVREMARAAATQDPRFLDQPIRPSDVPHLEIEVSVLSPLERTREPLSLELGKHGIYIRRGMRTGCFLPQVATETGWSKEEFLDRCCEGKAGLSAGAWRDAQTEVYLFTAEIIEQLE